MAESCCTIKSLSLMHFILMMLVWANEGKPAMNVVMARSPIDIKKIHGASPFVSEAEQTAVLSLLLPDACEKTEGTRLSSTFGESI